MVGGPVTSVWMSRVGQAPASEPDLRTWVAFFVICIVVAAWVAILVSLLSRIRW